MFTIKNLTEISSVLGQKLGLLTLSCSFFLAPVSVIQELEPSETIACFGETIPEKINLKMNFENGTLVIPFFEIEGYTVLATLDMKNYSSNGIDLTQALREKIYEKDEESLEQIANSADGIDKMIADFLHYETTGEPRFELHLQRTDFVKMAHLSKNYLFGDRAGGAGSSHWFTKFLEEMHKSQVNPCNFWGKLQFNPSWAQFGFPFGKVHVMLKPHKLGEVLEQRSLLDLRDEIRTRTASFSNLSEILEAETLPDLKQNKYGYEAPTLKVRNEGDWILQSQSDVFTVTQHSESPQKGEGGKRKKEIEQVVLLYKIEIANLAFAAVNQERTTSLPSVTFEELGA